MLTPKKQHPLGKFTPWVWVFEPSHGCNLRCGHCSCRLNEPGQYHFMTMETWEQGWRILAEVSPTCRVDLCLGGEPTLNPRLYEMVALARKISPLTQIQITTNGTNLLTGKFEYRKALDAGVNIIYTDMYGPKEGYRERYIELAKAAGVPWYEYYDPPADAISPWVYTGPELKMIVLQEQPENWPKSRYRAGLLGTWYNHLDWPAAERFGLKPVTTPPARRCNQPFRYVPVDSRGNYLLCCQDNTGETSGMFGNVSEGKDGFLRFWQGEKLQRYRVNLMNKDRAANPQCSRCNITFSRCDYKHYSPEMLEKYWDGTQWVPMQEAA